MMLQVTVSKFSNQNAA